jgi:hypothetical protein
MSESDQLLELIEDGIVAHGGDLGGWTRRADGALQLFDGRVTLRAESSSTEGAVTEGQVHLHALATLHEHDDEVLDACLFGMGDDRAAALAQAAMIWITSVAGPIKSFIDNKPVCMTCQAGVAGGDLSKGYSEADYGLPNLRAYVGPVFSRGVNDDAFQAAIDGTKPWFRFAAESAAPRRVHLAKVTVICKGKNEGSHRELEIDGHDVSHHDPDWPIGASSSQAGLFVRFAVFEFPRNSPELARRAELERTIRHFAENFSKYENVDRLMDAMISQGFDSGMVHEVESIGTIAFGRLFFERHGVDYASTIIRAHADGRIETDVLLGGIPVYSRARAIGAKLMETMSEEEFQRLCLYNAESNSILQFLDGAGSSPDLSHLKLFPSIVPDRGASQQTMDAAFAKLSDMIERNRAKLKKKPWWKFW